MKRASRLLLVMGALLACLITGCSKAQGQTAGVSAKVGNTQGVMLNAYGLHDGSSYMNWSDFHNFSAYGWQSLAWASTIGSPAPIAVSGVAVGIYWDDLSGVGLWATAVIRVDASSHLTYRVTEYFTGAVIRSGTDLPLTGLVLFTK